MKWSTCEFDENGQSAYMGDRLEYELDVWPDDDFSKWFWQLNIVTQGFSEELISAGKAANKQDAKIAAEAAYHRHIKRFNALEA